MALAVTISGWIYSYFVFYVSMIFNEYTISSHSHVCTHCDCTCTYAQQHIRAIIHVPASTNNSRERESTSFTRMMRAHIFVLRGGKKSGQQKSSLSCADGVELYFDDEYLLKLTLPHIRCKTQFHIYFCFFFHFAHENKHPRPSARR